MNSDLTSASETLAKIGILPSLWEAFKTSASLEDAKKEELDVVKDVFYAGMSSIFFYLTSLKQQGKTKKDIEDIVQEVAKELRAIY